MTRFHQSCRTGGVRVPSQLAALVRKEPPMLHFSKEEGALYCPSELLGADPSIQQMRTQLHLRWTHVVVR
jgi:hypothetical protein